MQCARTTALAGGGGGFLLANTRPHTHLTGSHTHWLVPTHVQWFPDTLPRRTARGSVSRDMLHCPANPGATRTANATTPTSASLTQTMATRQLDSQAQHSTPRTQIPLCYARSEQPIQTQTPKRLEVGQ